MSEKDVNAKRSLMNRFRNKRNIVSKSITTFIFALFMWHGRIDQLKGVPATHGYWVVTHSYDNGLLFMILLLALFGFYVGLSKKSTQSMRVVFLLAGFGLWTGYTVLFLYRDMLFPHWPSLQSMLVTAIAISFLIDLLAGDA